LVFGGRPTLGRPAAVEIFRPFFLMPIAPILPPTFENCIVQNQAA